ncbi:hypothetical protein LTR62_004134 [Meristemomyces frigidus]|uniref:Uncharacterized protein n=1 Tax=Meristemomyces frigidus TaxID=1508187 RepID=A0AAN7YN84_9PEZI|nr:hypothetical protein LTR62_004134 [Meristemomyces frigidus]
MEQLFPEETKKYDEAHRKAAREVPRLPLETPTVPTSSNPAKRKQRDTHTAPVDVLPARYRDAPARRHDAQGEQPTVLVLRNASKNLVEEDFRRLIPRGQHLEGWTLEQSDIIKIIPGRNLATLEQENFYYLLFSSKLGAFTYQGHATRISRMAASHTSNSLTSPLPPPPGYMIDGMDAHEAIESFTLVPASQPLEMRQLQPPLSPLMESIVRHQGYGALVRRSDKMPFEVRLTLDGPQISSGSIRRILLAVAQDRALGWSGGVEMIPKITEWIPRATVSPSDHHSRQARKLALANERTEEEQMELDLRRQERQLVREREGVDLTSDDVKQMLRRTPKVVYVVGFHTDLAAQHFVRHWHRKPMFWKQEQDREWEDDLPPVANAEILW